jgi:hypothetical protein
LILEKITRQLVSKRKGVSQNTYNTHSITNALPKCTNSTFLHIGHSSPFIISHPSDGFRDENAEGIQQIVLGDLAGFLIATMDVIYARKSLESTG